MNLLCHATISTNSMTLYVLHYPKHPLSSRKVRAQLACCRRVLTCRRRIRLLRAKDILSPAVTSNNVRLKLLIIVCLPVEEYSSNKRQMPVVEVIIFSGVEKKKNKSPKM